MISHFGEVCDGDLAFGELGDDLQFATYRLDVGAQAGDVYIGLLLQFGDGRLVYVERLREVTLGHLPRAAQLV